MAAGAKDEQEPGSYFVCTETSPRCYIIQQVSAYTLNRFRGKPHDSDDEGGQCERAQLQDTPPTPAVPWFTRDCEERMKLATETSTLQTSNFLPVPQVITPPQQSPHTSSGAMCLSPEQMREQLRKQLEYYFSRENLMTDRFLRSQMNNDSYVPIQIIADFPRVKQLTSDYNVIVQVLRESPRVQVDEKSEKVRAVSKRCTIILRDIPQSTEKKEVAALFAGGPPYLTLDYGLNNSWYITFESEEATQRAYLHLQNTKTFNNKPICARIKTGGAPCSEPMISYERPLSALSVTYERPPSAASATTSDLRLFSETTLQFPTELSSPSTEDFDLGKILASHGYVARSAYLPASKALHVFSSPHAPNTIRTNGGRLRGTGQSSHYRGNYRNRESSHVQSSDVPHHREYTSRREYSNSNYRNQHSSSRRVNNNSENYPEEIRERTTEHHPRGRISRPNGFSSRGSTYSQSRNYLDPQKSSNNANTRPRPPSDYEHRPKQSLTIEQSSNAKAKKTTNSQRITTRSPDKENETGEEYSSCSPFNEDLKSETSSKRAEDIEYNFEENAFPSLSEEVKEEIIKEEKPLFSKVAAGKRKEKKDAKERRSYAQMLKHGHGQMQA